MKRIVRRVLAAVAGVVVVAALLQVSGVLPGIVDTIDRSQPPVLAAVRDLSRYQAAAGDYELIIDVEKDVRWVPGFLAGERTLFVAAGTVTAYVDFGGFPDEALAVSESQKRVDIHLPPAVLDEPNLDQERCYVVMRETGLKEKVANAFGEDGDDQEFYVLAEQKIAAAADRSELRDRATFNTKHMLRGMFQALGYQVTFDGAEL